MFKIQNVNSSKLKFFMEKPRFQLNFPREGFSGWNSGVGGGRETNPAQDCLGHSPGMQENQGQAHALLDLWQGLEPGSPTSQGSALAAGLSWEGKKEFLTRTIESSQCHPAAGQNPTLRPRNLPPSGILVSQQPSQPGHKAANRVKRGSLHVIRHRPVPPQGRKMVPVRAPSTFGFPPTCSCSRRGLILR